MPVEPRRLVLLVVGLSALSAARSDDPSGPQIEREFTARSRYVWRGLVLEPGRTFETSTTVSFGNAWFNLWTYNRGAQTLWHRSAREVDYTLGWDFEKGGWSLSPSFTQYTFPNGWEEQGTGELALETSHELGQGFSLLANGYLDVGLDRGASFLELGLGFERELAKGWTLDASAVAGRGNRAFNLSNYEVGRNAWNAAYGEVGVAVDLGAGWSVRASGMRSRTLDRRLRDATDRPDSTAYSLTLRYSR